MHDRLFSGALLGLSGLIAWTAYNFEVPFQYEPLGPKAFPIILSSILSICAVWLFLKPSNNSWAPSKEVILKLASGTALMTSYAYLFDKAGFIISTAIVGFVFSMLFGEKPLKSAVYSIALSVVSYLVLKHLLQLNVPVGEIWS